MVFWSYQRSLTETRFRFYNIVFYFGGITLFVKSSSVIYRIFSLLVNLALIAVFFGLSLELYDKLEDMDNTVEVSMTLCLLVISFWTQFYLRFNKASVRNLLRFTDIFKWEDLPGRDPETGRLTSAALVSLIPKTTAAILLPGVTFHAIQTTTRIMSSEERTFLYSVWYPGNITESPVYEIINVTQAIASIPWISFFYGFPSMYGMLICIACSQLEKLRSVLLSIKHMDFNIKECPNEQYVRKENVAQEMAKVLQKQLNICIEHHQSIIRYINLMEDVFSPLLVGHFLMLMITLCFTAYSAVSRWGNLLQLVQSIFIYGVLIIIVFVFCWFGSLLTEQAELVRDAAWGCEWVGTPIGFQRSISFIIAMANKDFMLTAGKCVPVSKETMMNMIQESISLFMFMLQVKESEDLQHQN